MPKYSSKHLMYAGVLTGIVTALAVPVSAHDADASSSVSEFNNPIPSKSLTASLTQSISQTIRTSSSLALIETAPPAETANIVEMAALAVPQALERSILEEEPYVVEEAPIILEETEGSDVVVNPESAVVEDNSIPEKRIGGKIKGAYTYKEVKVAGKKTVVPGFKPYYLCVTDFVPQTNPFKPVVQTDFAELEDVEPTLDKIPQPVEFVAQAAPEHNDSSETGPTIRGRGVPRYALNASHITDIVRAGYTQKDMLLKTQDIRTAMSQSFSQPIADAAAKEADSVLPLQPLIIEEEIAAIEVADPTALDKEHIVEQLEEELEAEDVEAKQLADAITPKPETTFETKTVRVKAGDTFENLLVSHGGVSKNNAYKICKKINRHYKLNRIKKGQRVNLEFAVTNHGVETTKILSSVSLDISSLEKVIAELNADGIYKAYKEDVALETEAVRAGGTIQGSIAASARKFGIPSGIVAQFVNNFSHGVDFRRDIHYGDKFEVMFEQKVTPDGSVVNGMGELLYASLTMRGKTYKLYRHEDDTGFVDYYDENGHGIKKGIRRRPLGRRRISSPFGMRNHPILRRKRMHWGIDYVAPSGTPIPAAGDGVIEVAKRNGAYGKFIKIRHNNKFKTAYAHMKGYGPGIKSGKRVKQGDIIGYVGNTGRSTGPHLHYEVHKYGKRVNPLRVKIPVAGRKLKGSELQRFVKTRSMINHIFASLSDTKKHAKLEKSLVAKRTKL